MKKIATFLNCGIIGIISVFADNVIIKSPGYFEAPIRDGHELFPDSLVFPRDAESIHIPDIGMIGRFEDYGFR